MTRLLLLLSFTLLTTVHSSGQTDKKLILLDEVYSTLKTEYPLFEFRPRFNIDESYKTTKPFVSDNISDDSLATCICKMIEPLEDFHVRLYWGKGMCFAVTDSDWHKIFSSTELQDEFWKTSDLTLRRNRFQSIQTLGTNPNGEPLFRYSKADKIGYLNITAFENKKKDTEDLIDKVLSFVSDTDFLIIDLRACMGGFTDISELIASRFIETKTLYATSEFYENGKMTKAINHSIAPKKKLNYDKPIFLLTNQATRSAAEWFVLMVKTRQRISIIGEPTWGAFSNSNRHKLSNGWTLQFSIEKLRCADGNIYEGKGIPVDIQVENGLDDIESQSDKVISKTIDLIKGG